MSKIREISKEGNFVKFIPLLSAEQQIALSTEEIDTNITKIVADFFTSITKGGIPVHDIVSDLYLKYSVTEEDKTLLEGIGKDSIKIIHNSGYRIKNKNQNIPTSEISFYLKKSNNEKVERFGLYPKSEENKTKSTKLPLADISSCISKAVIKRTQDDSGLSINKNPENPYKLKNPSIVSILYNEPKYRFGNRNDTEMSLFFNIFTNLDIAKSYPYVNISVKMPTVIDSGFRKKVFQTSTINQFLFGTIDNDSTSKNFDLFGSNLQTNVNEDLSLSTGMNMSLFTMPQTYNNFNEKSIGQSKSDIFDNNRINPVLDISRPLATIKSIDFVTSPTYGLKGHKQATLDLVVHDRSRLADVAPFIKPDTYGVSGPEFIIDYGWSHINGDISSDPKARIINSMKIKERYNIIQSSSTINADGQANIKLTLSQVGNNAFKSIIVKKSQTAGIINVINVSKQKIINLIKTINRINRKNKAGIFYHFDNEFSENITVTPVSRKFKKLDEKTKDVLTKALSEINKAFVFRSTNITKYFSLSPEELQDENIIEFDQKINDNIDLHEEYFNSIKNHLIEIKSNTEKLTETIKEEKDKLDTEYDQIFGKTLDDPYIDKEHIKKILPTIFKGDEVDAILEEHYGPILKRYVSFGKVVTYFVSNYMSTLGRFDEIQLIFHTVNSQAALMRYRNIASFIIEKEKLKEFFSNDLFNPESNVKYSIEGLLTRIIREFIFDESQPGYGLSTIHDKKDKKSDKDFREEIKKSLSRIYGRDDDLIFKRANVKVFLDCLSPSEPDISSINSEDKTVLRLNFIDKNDDPYNSINQIIKKASNNNDIVRINREIVKNKIKNKKNKTKVDNIEEEDIKVIREILKDKIETTGTGNNREIIVSLEELKNIKHNLKSMIPSVTVGAENSPIRTASATLSTAGDLNTIFMNRGSKNYKVKGVKFDADLPLRVVPSQITMKMLGCPFINFGQYIFLDFLTGTNIDNAYTVTSMNHSIKPGSFETTVVFGQGSAQAYSEHYSGIESVTKFLERIKENKINIVPKKQTKQNDQEEDVVIEINEANENAGKRIIFDEEKNYEFNKKNKVTDGSTNDHTRFINKEKSTKFKDLLAEKLNTSNVKITYNSYIKYLYNE